jgi:hypothetical protein
MLSMVSRCGRGLLGEHGVQASVALPADVGLTKKKGARRGHPRERQVAVLWPPRACHNSWRGVWLAVGPGSSGG